MKKVINVTGACNPQRHYMADISEKLGEMTKSAILSKRARKKLF